MPTDKAFAAIEARLHSRRLELTAGDRRVQSRQRPMTADFEDQGHSLDYDDSADILDDATLAAIAEINDALERMADGTYGTCSICKRPIELTRLETFPLAVTCQKCSGAR